MESVPRMARGIHCLPNFFPVQPSWRINTYMHTYTRVGRPVKRHVAPRRATSRHVAPRSVASALVSVRPLCWTLFRCCKRNGTARWALDLSNVPWLRFWLLKESLQSKFTDVCKLSTVMVVLHSPGCTEEKHEITQSEELVSEPRFELWISQIRSTGHRRSVSTVLQCSASQTVLVPA
jgi:hypothetical protein